MSIEDLTKGRSQFSVQIPGLQLAWDSTSLGLLKECPRKYYYSIIEMWRSKSEALPLTWGIMYHSCLETYDRVRAKGATHEEGVHAAVQRAFKMSAKYEEVVDAQGNKEKIFKPWKDTGDNRRTLPSLVRSVVWYYEQFKDDPAETVLLADGSPAVELNFKMQLGITAPDGSDYVFCGHMDRMVTFQRDLWVKDRKTTTGALNEDYFEKYNPENQMSGYTVAAQVCFDIPAKGVIIDAVQTAVNFSRFKRGFTFRTKGQNEEWISDTAMWLELAEKFADQGYWPKNEKSCHNYGGCKFINICNKDPKVRKMFLDQSFEKVDWNPLIPREENRDGTK